MNKLLAFAPHWQLAVRCQHQSAVKPKVASNSPQTGPSDKRTENKEPH